MRVMVAAVLAALGAAAAAQGVNRSVSDLGLSRDEWAMMDAASASLYRAADPVEGSTATWTAPSGASGVVTAEAVGPRGDGALCVSLLHEVTRAGYPEPLRATVKRCRINGAWVISAE